MVRTQHFVLTLAMACAAVGAGCSDELVDPRVGAERNVGSAPSYSLGAETGDHLVVFSGGVPADFATSVADLGGSVKDVYENIGIALVAGLSGAGAESLRSQDGVSAVGPDMVVGLAEPVGLATEPVDVVASPTAPDSAFFYARQWNMRAVGADKAWAAGKLGSPDVTVAILDTGIDYLYPDLAGLVDLSRSVSMVPSDDALVAAFFPGRHPITDLRFHGTHVSAIVSSNALVQAGVTSRITLMGVKVLNVNGSGFLSTVLAGIEYATDNGADVINLSLGGAFDRVLNKDAFKAVEQTLFYALTRGVLVVAAAGNSALDINGNGTIYENYCESFQVLCVTATGPTSATSVNGPWTDIDAFAPYSNFGRFAVSVAAPGGNAGGPVWSACSTASLVIPICRTGIFTLGASGTSMSAPHASGLAALLVGKYGKNRPLTARFAISSKADDRGAPGRDPLYGWGRINVKRALGLKDQYSPGGQ